MTSMVSYYYALLYRAPFDESVWSKLERELKRSDEELSWENFMEVVRSIDAATTADAGQFAWLAKKEDGNFFPVFVRMLRDRLLQNAENLGRSRTACCFLLRVTAWLKDTEAAAESLLALADIALTNNHPYATLSLAVMAHKAAEENENIYAVIRAGVLKGRALRVLRKERMSVSCFEDAIAHIEDSRRRLLTPDQQALYLAMQIDAYAELITTFVDLGLNVQALEYAERSKARSLVDLLSNRKLKVRDHSAHELLAEEASLQEKLDSLKRQIRQSRQAEPNPADLRDSHEEAGINEAETERHQDLPVLLADAQRKLSTIKQRIRKSSGEWASLTNATPLAYADPAANNDLCRMLRGSLGPLMEKSVVLQYYVTQDETLIFVVPAWEGAGDGVTVHRSPLGIARLQELTRDDFLSTIVEASEDPTFLEELYTHLFQPVLPDLSRLEATAILFAPHSYLHALPLQAMYYQEAGNRRYVIDDYPCGFIPNISTLEHLSAKRQPRGTAALIMGNPRQAEDTDGDLPFAEQETRYVADILQAVPLVREKATKDALMKQVADKQVIHLACHGFYSSTDPLQSHLVLADGSLQVDEVLDLELEANLVTLSACSSGVSKISTGDELVGMARAWLYAGTPSVIASQWDIDDDSSSEIITLFYRNWIQDGQSKMRALQNAQKEAKDGWHTHPRSWAAFNLIGDPL
jgi:CHAT domain-containing protein